LSLAAEISVDGAIRIVDGYSSLSRDVKKQQKSRQ